MALIPLRHSVKSVAVAVFLRRLYPEHYATREAALIVAADRCAPDELAAAFSDAALERLARAAHERDIREP